MPAWNARSTVTPSKHCSTLSPPSDSTSPSFFPIGRTHSLSARPRRSIMNAPMPPAPCACHLMNDPPASLIIRLLRASDLDVLFDSRQRPQGEAWLERQARFQIYVAVAELDGVPVGRIAFDVVSRASQGAAYLFSAHVEPPFQSRGIGT